MFARIFRTFAGLLGMCILGACLTGPGGADTADGSGGAVPDKGPVIINEGGGAAGNSSETAAEAASLDEALSQSFTQLSRDLENGSGIAVISVASGDPGEAEYAAEELILLFVNAKRFRVVDRRSLDIILAEQNFQLGGEVDDDTAVFIGRLTGAGIVITGSISVYDSVKYVRLKALDVESSEIRAMTSRRIVSF
jgi:hypothetical protein